MSSSNERLSMIRQLMKSDNIDAYIIPVTDPHLGEYVPDRWKIVRWLTGFTGSAANVVITSDFAGLWTDSRYFIQAEEQLCGSGFKLVKLKIPHTPEYIDWMAVNLPEGSRVAVDGRVIPIGIVNLLNKSFRREKISLVTDNDYISGIWEDRPSMPAGEAFEHSIVFAGISRREKIKLVRTRMNEMVVDYHLLTSLDDIAWLMNIRGNDVNYSPLFTAFGLVTPDQFLL
ncbi:MAG: aminopeptidase P family N-terminal domain-containing protein, partial [Bacteroidales bacterium]|nr:aminopeptidase P family N-terminal domain-containing protein [Bacteroidales bacterium]